jgi:hypothetical protein
VSDFGPKGWPKHIPSESRTPAEGFAFRLRQLGATEGEIETTIDRWGQDPEEDARLRRMNDRELTAELSKVRAEHHDSHHIPTGYRTDTEAAKRVEGSVDAVLAWVAGDPERAAAAARHESNGKQRSTLLRRLNAMLEAD